MSSVAFALLNGLSPGAGSAQAVGCEKQESGGFKVLWSSGWHTIYRKPSGGPGIEFIYCRVGGPWTTWEWSFRNHYGERAVVKYNYVNTADGTARSYPTATIEANATTTDVTLGSGADQPDFRFTSLEFPQRAHQQRLEAERRENEQRAAAASRQREREQAERERARQAAEEKQRLEAEQRRAAEQARTAAEAEERRREEARLQEERREQERRERAAALARGREESERANEAQRTMMEDLSAVPVGEGALNGEILFRAGMAVFGSESGLGDRSGLGLAMSGGLRQFIALPLVLVELGGIAGSGFGSTSLLMTWADQQYDSGVSGTEAALGLSYNLTYAQPVARVWLGPVAVGMMADYRRIVLKDEKNGAEVEGVHTAYMPTIALGWVREREGYFLATGYMLSGDAAAGEQSMWGAGAEIGAGMASLELRYVSRSRMAQESRIENESQMMLGLGLRLPW